MEDMNDIINKEDSSLNKDLPSHALERLSELRSQDNPKGVFTSDLSVNEFLLVKECGFEPIGLVMGSSVYHVGVQMSKWNSNMEMETLTEAMYKARELAVSRMVEEAKDLGADGVVGVRLDVKRHSWGENVIEFVAIGTAVFSKDRSKQFRLKDDKPFTSDLSGQDFWTLLKSGYRPLSLVMGTCVYHIARQGLRKTFSRVGQNVELTDFTQSLYDARELSMERMQNEAHSCGAEGVVGVSVQEGSQGFDSHIIEYFAIGTSVISMGKSHNIKTPDLVMMLNK
jgi:uncharacterized protein YbjQ (UPF0145 family)